MSSSSNHPGSAPSSSVPVSLSGNASSLPNALDKNRKVSNVTGILCNDEGEVIQAQDESGCTINVLPDDILLEIFNACRKKHDWSVEALVWRWHGLAHVCKRWRQVIFGSSCGLDLQMFCTHGTPLVTESLNIWPPFPIAIRYNHYSTFFVDDTDNLFAALEHHGRIRQVSLALSSSLLGAVATKMQQSFPPLTHLALECVAEMPPAFPSGFLNGSAPCLQYMLLHGIHFPALPALLSSASDLVDLHLYDIPPNGCISPESMAACLAGLPRLKFLTFGFKSATSPNRHMPPVTRSLFPSLTVFIFRGDSEYLEDLTARIDSPRLNLIAVDYLNQPLGSHIAQLFKFIDRSEDPEISLIRHADISFSCGSVTIEMYPYPESSQYSGRVAIEVEVDFHQIERQISLIAQVFSQPSTTVSRVFHLTLHQSCSHDMYGDRGEWLPLLRQFSTVRTLRVSYDFALRLAPRIALALEDVPEEMVVEVLPIVDLIYLVGLPISRVGKFVAARQLSGHPVTIVDSQAVFDERVMSYAQ